MKRLSGLLSLLALFIFYFLVSGFDYNAKADDDACLVCHKTNNPGLYGQYESSAHYRAGITCIDCHGAEFNEPDAFDHNGYFIATLVTPKDCGTCHPEIEKQVDQSYHSTAGLILDSQDSYLAHTGGGEQAAIIGCESCHGTKVVIDENSPNKLSAKSWPNSGIGRLNPDGSKGSCNACHTRHSFSKRQARQPEACGKCHLGPDHPQKEVFEESKHGNTYFTNRQFMNLDSDSWVVGQDYFAAPTCVTCHMGANQFSKGSHDVGLRLKWTLRPPISKYKENHEAKRENMKKVCVNCHSDSFAQGHFYQFDALVHLYNEKFAKPAADIMAIIRENELRERNADFANDIDWIYWELWHHEGRRARHGAAMMGPDYAWWHGIYDVIHNFYFEFIPAALAFDDSDVTGYIENLYKDPMHQWLTGDTETLKNKIRSGKMQIMYHDLYEEKEEK